MRDGKPVAVYGNAEDTIYDDVPFDQESHLLLMEWREQGHVHENYCADTGQGCNSKKSDRFYHWGGLLGLISILDKDA
jgi:hypothetical protein